MARHKEYEEPFIENTENKNELEVKDFLVGAFIGGIVGAVTALFLAPKTGQDLRHTMNEQATFIKGKGISLQDKAIKKGTQLIHTAKEKTIKMGTISTSQTDHKGSEENELYVPLKPHKGSYEEIQQKLIETQKALEEEELRLKS